MPRTITLIYLVFGVIWIFFTDRLLVWLHLDPGLILRLQTFKGWLFIAGSALLLYVLLRRQQRRDDAALEALRASQDEVRRANSGLEQRVAERTRQLEAANRELESFAYAVSHDLRAPLRSLSGFSQILQESATNLDDKSKHYLQRIQEASQRMSSLIEDLLGLSRISRSEFNPRALNLSEIVAEAVTTVRERYAGRDVELTIAPGMNVTGDARLLRIALENLLDNAWKYTARAAPARVSVGVRQEAEGQVCFVSDNGVGFDMAYAGKLFVPFQRLHADAEFPGSGIGLVTVQRIIARHGGRVWGAARPGEGATFSFTLGS
jgi:light-regulated signal transduction histidine kinase (bacteriophytochrome)